MEELENTVAESKGKVKELRKITEKLEKAAAITQDEVVRLTGVVGEPQKAATQAVEESKHHTQVATSVKDRLDALTSEKLEEDGEVREARPQAPPHRGDFEPAVQSRDPYPRRETWKYPSPTPPDDQESGISQSSAAPSAKSGRVSRTPPRAPPPRGYQAVPPATGYKSVRSQGKWQQGRLLRVQERQKKSLSANCYEELHRYGPEEKNDDIDVSHCSGISLEDMLDQKFERLPLPYSELEEERNIAHDMDIHAVGTQAAYGGDRERYSPQGDWEPRGRVPILASSRQGDTELGDTRDLVPPHYSGNPLTPDQFFRALDICSLQLCVEMAGSDGGEYPFNRFCYRLPKALQTLYLQDLADGKIKVYKQAKKWLGRGERVRAPEQASKLWKAVTLEHNGNDIFLYDWRDFQREDNLERSKLEHWNENDECFRIMNLFPSSWQERIINCEGRTQAGEQFVYYKNDGTNYGSQENQGVDAEEGNRQRSVPKLAEHNARHG